MDPPVGAHSKSRHRAADKPGRVLTRAAEAQPWTHRYPAITIAALAGTLVGAPGGVAAAMAVTGVGAPAAGPSHAVVATSPVVAPPSASASPSTSPTPAPTATPTAPPNPYAHTTLAQLEPTGVYGTQSHFTATASQWANAKTIVKVAEQRKMPLYAAVIAVATATQESRLQNLTVATNADSLGLFQQRPSAGWGTAAQLTTPSYASNAFLSALDVYAPHYMSLSLWQAAQAVQRSAFPTAYAQWQSQAAHMVMAIVNGTAP
ncbi:MAG TPA: hypothetical protein VFU73_02170 [Actinocrinis sp.]|nr:hypothetical protein [Actinocrinis sp.]